MIFLTRFACVLFTIFSQELGSRVLIGASTINFFVGGCPLHHQRILFIYLFNFSPEGATLIGPSPIFLEQWKNN
jgi:hypothetical protein